MEDKTMQEPEPPQVVDFGLFIEAFKKLKEQEDASLAIDFENNLKVFVKDEEWYSFPLNAEGINQFFSMADEFINQAFLQG